MPTAGEKKKRERTASADLGQASRTRGAWHRLQILTSHPVFLQAMWATGKQRTQHLTTAEAPQTNLHSAYCIIFMCSLSTPRAAPLLISLPVSLPHSLRLSVLQSRVERQLTLALSQLSQINVIVPRKSLPARCLLFTSRESRSDAICCSLTHNAEGRAKTSANPELHTVLCGTALDVKQQEAGLKSNHVEQSCRDQWVMCVIFRNSI